MYIHIYIYVFTFNNIDYSIDYSARINSLLKRQRATQFTIEKGEKKKSQKC